MPLTQSEQAQVHRALCRAMLQGHTVEACCVSERGLTVIANRFAAARWKQEFGDTFAGAPLRIFTATRVGVPA